MTLNKYLQQNGTTTTVQRFESVKSRDLEAAMAGPEIYIQKDSKFLALQKKYGLSDGETEVVLPHKPLFISIMDLRLIKAEIVILIIEHYSLVRKLINNEDLGLVLDEALESCNSKEELEDLLADCDDEVLIDKEESQDYLSIAEHPEFIELQTKYILDDEDTLMVFPLRLLFTKIIDNNSVNTKDVLVVMDHYLQVLKLVFEFGLTLEEASSPEEFQYLFTEEVEEDEEEEIEQK